MAIMVIITYSRKVKVLDVKETARVLDKHMDEVILYKFIGIVMEVNGTAKQLLL